MEELKPCPFCGGEAKMHAAFAHGVASRVGAYVECGSCGAWSKTHWGDGAQEKTAEAWNRRAERTWHDFADELPPAKKPVLCKGRNGALYVGKPVTFVDGTRTRKVWVPRGDQYRKPEKWMEIGE